MQVTALKEPTPSFSFPSGLDPGCCERCADQGPSPRPRPTSPTALKRGDSQDNTGDRAHRRGERARHAEGPGTQARSRAILGGQGHGGTPAITSRRAGLVACPEWSSPFRPRPPRTVPPVRPPHQTTWSRSAPCAPPKSERARAPPASRRTRSPTRPRLTYRRISPALRRPDRLTSLTAGRGPDHPYVPRVVTVITLQEARREDGGHTVLDCFSRFVWARTGSECHADPDDGVRVRGTRGGALPV